MNTPDQHHFARGLDTSALPAVVDRATWQAELDIQFESDRVEFLALFGGARSWGRLRLRNLLVRFSKTQPVAASYPCGLSRAA